MSRKFGLGYARNWGVRQAHHEKICMFDDDLWVSLQQLWIMLKQLQPNQFAMTFLGGFPCTRVMMIHQQDFWKIGGFDEHILFSGEDRDFYVRAKEAGLSFIQVPSSLISHIPHPRRTRNIHTAIRAIHENVALMVKYQRYWKQFFKIDFWERFKHGQARTLLIELAFLPYCLITKGEL